MKSATNPLPWLICLLLAGCGAAAYLWAQPKAVADAAPRTDSFAVAELFTSEGCSSCPPADEVLADIVKDADSNRRPIYALAFHVDYWNRLGWADPFSDAAFSQRQVDYGHALKLEDVGTPQMIVNGTTQFVGSDRRVAERAINAALATAPVARVTLQMSPAAKVGGYDVKFSVAGAPAGAVVNFAIVERGLSTKVPRGENGGRTLRHENVVRSFKTIDLPGGNEGTITVAVPAGVQEQQASLIAYVQLPRQGPILGAAAQPIAVVKK